MHTLRFFKIHHPPKHPTYINLLRTIIIMPRKKSRASKSSRKTSEEFHARKDALKQGVKHFGEEAGALGKRFGEKGEDFGKRMEKKGWECRGWCSGTFGIIWPVISAIVGILLLSAAAWFLSLVARQTGNAVLFALDDFILSNLGVFFIIFLLSAFLKYVSRCCRAGYALASPLSAAFGVTVFFWIAANVMLIANIGIGSAQAPSIANVIMKNLFPIFWIFLVIMYFVMMLRLLSGKVSHECCAGSAPTTPSQAPQKITAGGPKRLYRSGKDKVLGGVCGGIAEYFGVDPVLIRLIWVALILAGGSGVLLYIIAWIVIPRNPNHKWE